MKQFRCIIISLPLFFLLASCAEQKQDQLLLSKGDRIVVDDFGYQFVIPNRISRVTALAPNLTEFLGVVCSRDQIVGRTQNCNYPAWIESRSVINTYPMDFEAAMAVQPDLIFAMEGINKPSDIQRLREMGLNVFMAKISNLDSVRAIYKKIGVLTGNVTTSDSLLTDFNKRINRLVEMNNSNQDKRLRILALASVSPIYAYGANTLFTEKLKLLNTSNMVVDILESPYPQINSEYILLHNPDVILGGTFEQLDSTFFSIYPELKNTEAYKNGNVFPTDGDLMSRPGARVVESVEELYEIVRLAHIRILARNIE